MNKQHAKLWFSENPHILLEMSLHLAKCTVHRAVSKQGFTGLVFVEGTRRSQQCLQHMQNEVLQVVGHVDTTFFQQDGAPMLISCML
jgi:hypothetical protein